jgi:hypothetical protein
MLPNLLIAIGSLALAIGPSIWNQDQVSGPNNGQLPGYYFDVTYLNTTPHARYIVKIGIRSDVRLGRFDCVSQTGPLVVAADYVVRFDVSEPETIVQAKPPLGIDPGQAVRFTISYAMSAIGECGPWETRISAIFIFDNGDIVSTEPEVITRADYAELMRHRPRESAILNSLRSLEPGIRVAAIDQMVASNFDRSTIERILKAKLLDEDSRVRSEAARTAARMDVKPLAAQIASQLASATDLSEKSAYCIALDRLRDPSAYEALMSTLLDVRFPYPSQAKTAIIDLNSQYVPTKVRALLARNLQWLDSPSAEQRNRILDLCDILIAYRDTRSSKTLSSLLIKYRDDFPTRYLVSSIRNVTDADALITDRFLLSMRDAIRLLLESNEPTLRSDAIQILGRMVIRRQEVESILGAGLEDADTGVRRISARLIARRGLKSLSGQILQLWRDSTTSAEKTEYCEVLKALRIACE